MSSLGPKWENRFHDMADLVSTWSKDPGTKHGAVIVTKSRRLISSGYNGLPRGIEDTDARLLDREIKLKLTMHAEENAILFACQPVAGSVIVVTGHPCPKCAATIVQAGISEVVFGQNRTAYQERWASEIALAREILSEAGVYCHPVGRDNSVLTHLMER